MALVTNLVAFWELDNVNDAHGANTLTNTGPASFVAANVGNGVDITGASTYLSIADNAALSTGDIDFTIQLWAKFDNLTATRGVLGKCDNLGIGGDLEYVIYTTDTGFARLRLYNGSSFVTLETTSPLSTATWYHIIGYYNAATNTAGLIVNDGTPVTGSYSPGPWDTGNSLYIGTDFPSVNPFDGIIDQVGIWKRVLSAAEITQLYNGGNGLSYAAISAPRFILGTH